MQNRHIPRHTIQEIEKKFEGRVLYAPDCIEPQKRAKNSVVHIFQNIFLCERKEDLMAANQFAWKKFKWRVATLLDSGSVMTEDGILRYRTIDKRRPHLLSMAQKRIDLIRRCEDLKQERREL